MKIPHSLLLRGRLTAAVLLGVVAPAADGQTLLSRYTLDGNGTDSGTVGITGAPVGTAAYGASGSGVGPFDKAFSTGDGTNDYFSAPTGGNAAFGVSAITIALWVNVDSMAASDRLVSNLAGSTGFDFYLQSPGAGAYNLAFGFNSSSGAVQSSSTKYVTDQWLFLAVTYDSATSTVSFYSGNLASGVGLNSTATKSGSIAASSGALEIGGTPATTSDRSPVALFNDVRIYSGALSLSELEAIRTAAVIPEPSHYATIFGLLSLGALAMRGRGRIVD
ncbi:MAG: anchor protein [Rariglobus sp.]|jgi:hypothetical protein|nr:anchor protein [Rariglobus sp.]